MNNLGCGLVPSIALCVVLALCQTGRCKYATTATEPPLLVDNNTKAIIAPNVPPIPIGLWAMTHVSLPAEDKHGKNLPLLNLTEARKMIRNDYIVGVSVEFSLYDVWPDQNKPPSMDRVAQHMQVIDEACEAEGKARGCLPFFLKPFLSNLPTWMGTVPPLSMGRNQVGMRVLGAPTSWQGVMTNATVPLSCDPAWHSILDRVLDAIDAWLGEQDARVTRVPIVHFLGPLMTSLQMRPGPQPLFDYLSAAPGVNDTLGWGWNKECHIDAWVQRARRFGDASRWPHVGKRAWAFDFTVLPAKSNNASFVFFDTADQTRPLDALEQSHPLGPGAVLAKTESLHVNLDFNHTHSTCSAIPPANDSGSHASFQEAYMDEPLGVPYQFIGNRTWRHGWEDFSPIAMPALPGNRTAVPSMYPLAVLGNNSLYRDIGPGLIDPVVPQGTLWAEVWQWEAADPWGAPACVSGDALAAGMREWNRRLREEYVASVRAAAL